MAVEREERGESTSATWQYVELLRTTCISVCSKLPVASNLGSFYNCNNLIVLLYGAT
jgi:hypothetical protein